MKGNGREEGEGAGESGQELGNRGSTDEGMYGVESLFIQQCSSRSVRCRGKG